MTLRFLDLTLLINTLNRQIDVNCNQVALRLKQVTGQIMLMLEKNRQRHQLCNLSDDRLKDLGITRQQVQVEAEKLFWH